MTEMAGVGSAAEVLAGDQAPHRRIDAADAHGDCANCGAHLTGPYCHRCGQKGHLHTRIWHMAEDFVEGVMHFDGRLWRTLPKLALRPGRLSRDWIEGKRVRYVAPLHIFLFSIFLFFLALSLSGGALYTAIFNGIAKSNAPAAAEAGQVPSTPNELNVRVLDADDDINCTERNQRGMARTMCDAIEHIQENPKLYAYKAETTTYKLAPLLAPITMVLLALLLVFKRGYTFYDHGVVALYGLSFTALLTTAAIVLNTLAAGDWPLIVLPILFVHALLHLRGAYRLSWFGAGLRTLLLGFLISQVFGVFLFFIAAWSAA